MSWKTGGGRYTSRAGSTALKSGETNPASPSVSHHGVLIVHRLVVADGRCFESAASDTSLPVSASRVPSFDTVIVFIVSSGSAYAEFSAF